VSRDRGQRDRDSGRDCGLETGDNDKQRDRNWEGQRNGDRDKDQNREGRKGTETVDKRQLGTVTGDMQRQGTWI
jgi:hypothetical protein